MEKVEQFIRENTRNCCNVSSYNSMECAIPWLTPDDARKAVEIAREETVKEVCEWLRNNANKYIVNTTPSYMDADFSAVIGDMCWEDLKKYLDGKV